MKMPGVMRGQGRFAQVPRADIPRSQFKRSHGHKTTFDARWLVPIFVDEVLPGDTFSLRMSGFARLATPLKPLMDNMYLDTFFFFVPYRLLWDNWEKFNGAQDNPGDSTDFTVPQLTCPVNGFLQTTLEDYMGVPTQILPGASGWSISALPRRAYYKIYNEWFRDENLINSVTVPTGDGPDTTGASGTNLLVRGKRHDYFTSCLPWPQKGTAIELPLGTVAPVVADSFGRPLFQGATGTVVSAPLQAFSTGAPPQPMQVAGTAGTWTAGENLDWYVTGLEADLSSATAATINELREAFQIQKMLERDARGGTRYIEVIKAHFGVTSPDARLQRSEYLGGGTAPIIVSPIAQNSANATEPTPQGNLAGIGTGSFSGHGFTKSFTEHGVIIGLINARADLTYQQGLERFWSRQTRFDFYWPALAQIGEQAVLNKEIYLDNSANDDLVFGYQERYAEYRYKPSRVTGHFRSNHPGGNLDIWHLSQEFAVRPTLNQTFIEENPPIDRVIAVPDEPHFIFDSWFDLVCARPMPVYGVPGMIDHF